MDTEIYADLRPEDLAQLLDVARAGDLSVEGLRLRVQGLELRVQDLGLRVQCLGFSVQG